MDPKRWHEEKLKCHHKHPIVVAIDVTGSMGNWSKIIYDKMPMFYGQIMMQGYLTDPSLSICGIGDATCDKAPLQIGEFGQGEQLDQIIQRLWLEGGGGCGSDESYELAAYFYSRHTTLINCELPFFFVTGDEMMYNKIDKDVVTQLFGGEEFGQKQLKSSDIWNELMKKYNVFYVHKPYADAEIDKMAVK